MDTDKSLFSLESSNPDCISHIECRESSFGDLPPEIVIKIFSYLDHCSKLKIKLICRSWKDLVGDPLVWQNLSIENVNDCDQICELISYYNLKTLCMNRCNMNFQIFNLIMQATQNLRSFILKFCNIDGINETPILKAFEECLLSQPLLRVINFEGSDIPSPVLDILPNFVKLRSLNLSHCRQLKENTLISIMQNCTNLEELDIDGIYSMDDKFISLLFTNCHTTLKSLSLDGDNLNDKSFEYLGQCHNLYKLSISFCDSLTNYTLRQVKKLYKLNYLMLRKGIQFTASGLSEMFMLGSFSNLRHLNLSECSSLNDSCLLIIIDICNKLIELNLGWCWELTDISISCLVIACSKLENLDLTGLMVITGKFVDELNTGFLPFLKNLNLEQCSSIDDDKLKLLCKNRPDINIIAYWGTPVTSDAFK